MTNSATAAAVVAAALSAQQLITNDEMNRDRALTGGWMHGRTTPNPTKKKTSGRLYF